MASVSTLEVQSDFSSHAWRSEGAESEVAEAKEATRKAKVKAKAAHRRFAKLKLEQAMDDLEMEEEIEEAEERVREASMKELKVKSSRPERGVQSPASTPAADFIEEPFEQLMSEFDVSPVSPKAPNPWAPELVAATEPWSSVEPAGEAVDCGSGAVVPGRPGCQDNEIGDERLLSHNPEDKAASSTVPERLGLVPTMLNDCGLQTPKAQVEKSGSCCAYAETIAMLKRLLSKGRESGRPGAGEEESKRERAKEAKLTSKSGVKEERSEEDRKIEEAERLEKVKAGQRRKEWLVQIADLELARSNQRQKMWKEEEKAKGRGQKAKRYHC